MVEKIRVLIKEPGEQLRVEEIDNTLRAMQRLVGGRIETVTLPEGVVVICDEEWQLKGKRFNCAIGSCGFGGTIVILGTAGDEFSDISPAEEDMVRRMIL